MELDPVILSRLQLLSASLTFQLRRMSNSPCRPPKVHVRERCYIHRGQSLAERTLSESPRVLVVAALNAARVRRYLRPSAQSAVVATCRQ